METNRFNVPEIFEVKTARGYKIVHTREVLFIKAEGKFSVIYFDDNSSLITFHMLGWFESFLLPPCFIRCHYSYLVNCCHVGSIDHTKIIIKEKINVPLSRKKAKHFRENLRQFHMKINLIIPFVLNFLILPDWL